jgi:hypothetical protein
MASGPAELLRGAPLYAGLPDRLFDTYDYVLVGTVVAVRPAAPTSTRLGGGPQAQDVVIDVTTVFNRTTTPARVTISMPDRGEMLGYPFDIGRSYVVAVKDNQVGLCSPTTPLESVNPDPEKAVRALQAAALAGGVAVTVPGGATTIPAPSPVTPAVPPAAAPASRPSARLVGGGAAAALGAALVGGTLVIRTRRRRSTGPDDIAGS